MFDTPLASFEHRFFGSMIDRDDPQIIPNYYAQNIENWLIRNPGELEMRDGITARGTSPSATNLGSAVLYKASGVKKFVRVINGAANTSKFQSSDDGTTWTDITGGGSKTTNAIWSLKQANDNLYGVNGYDTAIKFDGSTITTIAGIPQGTALEWWKNFLWVIGNPTFKDRLYFSNAADPETFGGSSFVNVNLGDGSPGVGIKGTSGSVSRLYIGKARSVWFLTGSSSSDFAIQNLTYEHGVASNESMVEVKNSIWCADLEGNIRDLYRSSTNDPFSSLASEDIQTTVAGLNKAALYKTTAVVFNNFVLFFVPNGVDDYNSLVLCWDILANNGKGGWTKFTGWRIARASVFNETQPKLFLHDARTNNGQTYEWTGTSDAGTAIIAKYETKVYDHGFPDRQKVWKFAYQHAPSLGSVNVRFYVSIDRYYYVLLKTFPLTGVGSHLLGVDWVLGTDLLGSGGAVRQQIYYTEGGGNSTGYTQQVKLEAESTSTKVKIRRFSSHYRLKGLR